ncbi:MAG TPA: PP2C family protein-serine/threonine phosphatase [Acidimicrobiales bacterium]|nr:PP2C family protein-serine/threonine phosphatase [Acidimicrobiales bacterium]
MAHHGARIGLDDVVVLLTDLEQRVLVPFRGDRPPASVAAAESRPIDGSRAGRAYRTERPVVGDRVEGRTTVWMPLLDSAERLGVLAASTTRVVDDHALGAFAAFASLVAEVVANKSGYGDAVVRTRQARPLTLSAELRWSMLPPLTFTGRNVTISGVLEPAYEIGGDTFDYAVNGSGAHLAIIDAVGHGLEAARIANLAVAAFREGRRRDLDLPGLYGAMDAALAGEFGVEKFATAHLATLALDTGRLRWINAGHPAPLVLRQGHPLHLMAEPDLPLGLAEPDTTPATRTLDLEPGDLLLLFTDGVVEARSVDGEEFGRDRLVDLLVRAGSAAQTPAETVRRLAHAVLDHQEGVLQDDGTLLLVVWHGPPAPWR